MKKIQAIIIMLLLSLFLVACSKDSLDIPKEKGKQLDETQTATFVEKLNFNELLTTDDFKVSYNTLLETNFNITFENQIKSSFMDVKNFTSLKGGLNQELSIQAGQNISDLLASLTLNGNVDLEIQNTIKNNFDNTQETNDISANLNLDVEAYIKDTDLYVNGSAGTVTKTGFELTNTVKFDKSKVVNFLDNTNEEDFDFGSIFELGEIDFEQIDFNEFFQYVDFKVFKKGSDHQIFITVTKEHLTSLILDTLGLFLGNVDFQIDEYEEFVELLDDAIQEFEFELYFELKGTENKLVKTVIYLKVKIDLSYTQDEHSNYKLVADVELRVATTLNSSDLKLPNLNNYNETTMEDLSDKMESVFGFLFN